MYIAKRHLSRRTVLRKLPGRIGRTAVSRFHGAPAQTPVSQTGSESRASPGPNRDRAWRCGAAPSMDRTNIIGRLKKSAQTLNSLKRRKPFEPFRDYLTIVLGTDLIPATAHSPKEEGADHFRSSAAYLTAAHPKMTEGADILCGTSIDQIYAQKFGQDTPIPSIQLCIESLDGSGACDYGYACVYADTISWASPTAPLPMTLDPRMVFEMLFGDGGTAAERQEREETSGSILDWISHSITRLQKGLEPSDRARLANYLDNVREIERRIQKIEKYNSSGSARALPAAPIGVPDSYDEHVKLMFDLQTLAFMTNMTRVSAFKMSRDVNQRVYPESGVKTPFHSCSHHAENPSRIAEFAKINLYHASLVPYFLQKLRDTPDGDGNLLDHSMVLYGSPIGDSNAHNHKRLPILLAGKANGRLKGNMHVKPEDGTPLANVLLGMMQKLGVEIDQIGDSTGVVAL